MEVSSCPTLFLPFCSSWEKPLSLIHIYALSQLGMAGEKGAKDIMDMCMYLLDRHQQVCQVGVGALCAQLSDSPKSMEQRARRAVERLSLIHI